jgi:hypothetical protein
MFSLARLLFRLCCRPSRRLTAFCLFHLPPSWSLFFLLLISSPSLLPSVQVATALRHRHIARRRASPPSEYIVFFVLCVTRGVYVSVSLFFFYLLLLSILTYFLSMSPTCPRADTVVSTFPPSSCTLPSSHPSPSPRLSPTWRLACSVCTKPSSACGFDASRTSAAATSIRAEERLCHPPSSGRSTSHFVLLNLPLRLTIPLPAPLRPPPSPLSRSLR